MIDQNWAIKLYDVGIKEKKTQIKMNIIGQGGSKLRKDISVAWHFLSIDGLKVHTKTFQNYPPKNLIRQWQRKKVAEVSCNFINLKITLKKLNTPMTKKKGKGKKTYSSLLFMLGWGVITTSVGAASQ